MKTNEYEMAWQTLKTVLEYSTGTTWTQQAIIDLMAKIEKQFAITEKP